MALALREIMALGMLPGIASAAARALVESGASFEEIINAPPADLASIGLRRAALTAVPLLAGYADAADAQIERAGRFGGSIVHFWSEAYPRCLREIYAPPTVLYVWGELSEADEHAVAVVGTRHATMYGRLVAETYAREFARAGVTVVSGLARGIDSFAHVAALKAGGRTIAVVASGLDEIQPAYAAELAARLRGQGAVITEYPFGVKALRPYFPQRNRIISGMAAGTVIVESDEKGGGMITAGFALDQNREVFAVPGSINAEKSRGTNLLIRTDRARLTQTPADVLDQLGYHVAAPERAPSDSIPAALTAFERLIYDELTAEPRHVDAIGEAAGLAPQDVLVSLLGLEFKGLVRQMAGRMFLRA